MIPISYIELLTEILKATAYSDFILDVARFNHIVRLLKKENYICRFTFDDLIDYAQAQPDIAEIKSLKICFKADNHWVREVKQLSQLYNKRAENNLLIDLWKEMEI